MDKKSDKLLQQIAQLDWVVEGFTAGKTHREIEKALDERHALVDELGRHWRKQEQETK